MRKICYLRIANIAWTPAVDVSKDSSDDDVTPRRCSSHRKSGFVSMSPIKASRSGSRSPIKHSSHPNCSHAMSTAGPSSARKSFSSAELPIKPSAEVSSPLTKKFPQRSSSVTITEDFPLGTWQNPKPFTRMKKLRRIGPDEAFEEVGSIKSSSLPQNQNPYPSGTWENPRIMQVPIRKRQASPVSISSDDHRVFGSRKTIRRRTIRSPSDHEIPLPSPDPLLAPNQGLPQEIGPHWIAESTNSSPAAGLLQEIHIAQLGLISPLVAKEKFEKLFAHSQPPHHYIAQSRGVESRKTLAEHAAEIGSASTTTNLSSGIGTETPKPRVNGSENGIAPLPHDEAFTAFMYGSSTQDHMSKINLSIRPMSADATIRKFRVSALDLDTAMSTHEPKSAAIASISEAIEAVKDRSDLGISSSTSTVPTSTDTPSPRASNSEIEVLSAGEWEDALQKYSDSDIEGILDVDTDSFPASPHPSAIDYSLCRVRSVDQPPAERRGKAVRAFNCMLVDEWNRRAATLTRNPALHRSIFEAYIAQSELESGEIKVINEVDVDGAPPDFEFECSNEMLYHPEVPDPELGLGCTCEGPCDPLSTTCTCVKRQELYMYGIGLKGFAYNE